MTAPRAAKGFSAAAAVLESTVLERWNMRKISRRGFLGHVAAMAGAAVATKSGFGRAAEAASGADLPRVDYHVHLEGVVTLDKALELSRRRGVKFGVVEHAGTKANKYPHLLSNDHDLEQYLAMLAGKPVFRGIQAEGLDWMTCFSKELVAQLDHVLTNVLTLPKKDGTRVEIWRPGIKIGDPQEFMDRYVDFHVQVMAREPIDILANVTFLPMRLPKIMTRFGRHLAWSESSRPRSSTRWPSKSTAAFGCQS